MSGHNKWSKIKHKKAASDAQKSRLFSKHSRLITMESRLCGGDQNAPNLFAAIERAKKDSMPKENIERAVTKGRETDTATLTPILFEAFGPGGTAILITAITDNNNRTAPEIKSIFTKAGYQLGTPGSAAWAFTKTLEGYEATAPVTLDDTTAEALHELLEKLEDHDDVQEVFTSAEGF